MLLILFHANHGYIKHNYQYRLATTILIGRVNNNNNNNDDNVEMNKYKWNERHLNSQNELYNLRGKCERAF